MINNYGGASINIGSGNDTINNSGSWAAFINTGAGNDLINFGDYNIETTINAGTGNDTINFGY